MQNDPPADVTGRAACQPVDGHPVGYRSQPSAETSRIGELSIFRMA
jgi:hypothetical protein